MAPPEFKTQLGAVVVQMEKKLVAIGLRPLRPLKIAVSQKRFENTFRHYRLEVKQYFRLWRVVKVQGLPGRRWGGGGSIEK
jgi:hypothetical protein